MDPAVDKNNCSCQDSTFRRCSHKSAVAPGCNSVVEVAVAAA
jgi:hypothetical protein